MAFSMFNGVAVAEFIGIFSILSWYYALMWILFHRPQDVTA